MTLFPYLPKLFELHQRLPKKQRFYIIQKLISKMTMEGFNLKNTKEFFPYSTSLGFGTQSFLICPINLSEKLHQILNTFQQEKAKCQQEIMSFKLAAKQKQLAYEEILKIKDQQISKLYGSIQQLKQSYQVREKTIQFKNKQIQHLKAQLIKSQEKNFAYKLEYQKTICQYSKKNSMLLENLLDLNSILKKFERDRHQQKVQKLNMSSSSFNQGPLKNIYSQINRPHERTQDLSLFKENSFSLVFPHSDFQAKENYNSLYNLFSQFQQQTKLHSSRPKRVKSSNKEYLRP